MFLSHQIVLLECSRLYVVIQVLDVQIIVIVIVLGPDQYEI